MEKTMEPLTLRINSAWARHVLACVQEDNIPLAKVCLFNAFATANGRRPSQAFERALCHMKPGRERDRELRYQTVRMTTEKEVRGFLNKVVFQKKDTLHWESDVDFHNLPINFEIESLPGRVKVNVDTQALKDWVKRYVVEGEFLLSLARHDNLLVFIRACGHTEIFGKERPTPSYQPKPFNPKWLKELTY